MRLGWVLKVGLGGWVFKVGVGERCSGATVLIAAYAFIVYGNMISVLDTYNTPGVSA